MNKLAISLAVGAIAAAVVGYVAFGPGCSISPEHARAVVLEDLSGKTRNA
jgi:hypothetical protein